ncbi:TonB-dependent receptor [Terrimonas sp. NA20]|uniref:TonB-dependent receptor n=1 Tax=Terrimonas ginsenosidimutans TaxID=2908004 RepID=A0ABS9KT04_9BACT|nr:TonB-dependent receptor [Terrimonas ginsenosidimutans]MCG2615458.1 TonB-dependent receptor [Terrimonas ginsenosidimutans]
MKIKLSLSLLYLFFSTLVIAQNRQISGQVSKQGNTEALAGVTVTLKGSQTIVITDKDGRYSIPVPAGGDATLVFSYVGHKTIEQKVTGSVINIRMEEDLSTLSDVVVVGYQSVSRKSMTGAVSSVSSKQLKDIPLSSAAEALQGRLAGVQVVSSEGAPGADIIIRVRGGSSITQDNSPLYIVDGVVVENALSVIAPQDIATVDVLKDASTTAIYGARAANGVVVITTKAGRSGKTQITYNGSAGWRKLSKQMEVLSPYDYVMWQYERSTRNITDSANFANTYGTTWDTLSVYKDIPAVNWQDRVFGRKAGYQNHNISVSGGNQGTTFNLSFTANREQGIQLESGFKRNLVNFKIDHKVSEKLNVGFIVRYLDQVVDGAGTTTSGARHLNKLRHAITYRPFALDRPNGQVDDFDEAYYLASMATNPVLLTTAEYRKASTRATYLTAYLNYRLAKNLVFRSTFGYDNTTINQDIFYSKITNQARNYATLPLASKGNQLNSTINNSNTLQYSVNNFKGHHDLSVLAGQEIIEQRAQSTYFETRYFPADISPEKALANMGLGSAPTGSLQPLPSSSVNPPSRIFSLFGRVNYGYDDIYLATFNLRSDRSSKFNYQNGSLLFPSGSVAWRFSKYKFMDKFPWLTDGKIRYGYGAVGNNRIGNLLYQQLYGVTGEYAFNHSILPGFAPVSLSNPNLKWEKNTTQNLGLDLAFFNSRLQLSVDFYRNVANDLLLQVNIPPTNGYVTQLQNIGSTSNRGIEVQLTAVPVQRREFTWNTSFNISLNRNRIESLGGVNEITRNSGWQGSDGVDEFLVKVGQPAGLMYGFVTDGYFGIGDFDFNPATQVYTLKPGIAANNVYGTPQPGMLKWKDISGPNGVPDGVITPDYDREVIGNANPKFTGGWNNQFSFKNFDMSVFVNFVVGNDIFNANKIEWTDGAFSDLNTLSIVKDRFTYINASGQRVTDPAELAKLNQDAKIWTPVRVQRWWPHSWAIEDGSYLRFNNITIGYTLPRKVLNMAKISSLRIYATVNNLATITNYSGYDPDVSARRADPLTPGVDFAAYPRSRAWVFGVNVSF